MDVFPNLLYLVVIGVLASPCEGQQDPGSGMLILCYRVYFKIIFACDRMNNELYTIFAHALEQHNLVLLCLFFV